MCNELTVLPRSLLRAIPHWSSVRTKRNRSTERIIAVDGSAKLQSLPKMLVQHSKMSRLFTRPSLFNVASFWSTDGINWQNESTDGMNQHWLRWKGGGGDNIPSFVFGTVSRNSVETLFQEFLARAINNTLLTCFQGTKVTSIGELHGAGYHCEILLCHQHSASGCDIQN